MIKIVITALAAAVLSGVFGYFLIPMLRALKVGQSILSIGPSWHNVKSGTPMMGGLMFVAAALVTTGVNAFFMEDYTALYVLALAVCFGLVGFVDDYTKLVKKKNEGLTSSQKAMLQMAVSAIFLYLLYSNGIMSASLYIPFVNISIELHPMVYIFFAMFVMVGCVNAVNLTDGVDGLCGLVTIPVMVFFTAAAFALDKLDLAVLPAAMVGALCAYLIYNWHPAKVFMGDTGSLFLGGIVCGMAFALDMPLILILVGVVYIWETMSVIIQVTYFKLTHGKRLFKMTPIHHSFEMSGWKEEKICIVFAGITAVGCLIAWFGISGLIG